MYAMRGLGSKESVQGHMNKLVTRGLLIKTQANAEMLLRVLNEHGIATLAEAAFRFARHELPADVVLTGTGSMRHLERIFWHAKRVRFLRLLHSKSDNCLIIKIVSCR